MFDMFEKFKIIKELKSLRRASVDGRFLLSLRERLEAEMKMNPRPAPTVVSVPELIKLIKINYMPVILTLAIIAVFGGGSAAMASQNSIPGDVLYPVKTLTEEVRAAVAVGAERKAELQTKFAAERVKEIDEILRQNGVDPAGLDIALLRLEEHVSRAADTIEKEKETGRDVSAIAKTIGEKFDGSKELLKTIVRTKEKKLESAEKELRTSAEEARKENAADTQELINRLEKIKTERKILKLRGKIAEEAVESEGERIEKEIDARENAQRAIAKAAAAKEEIVKEAAEKGLIVPSDAFKIFETHFAAANDAFKAGHFQQAKQQAKAAKEALKHVEKILEDENGEIDENEINEEKDEKEEIPESRNEKGGVIEPEESVPHVRQYLEENDIDGELKNIEERLIELNKETRFAPRGPLVRERGDRLPIAGALSR